MNPRPQKGTSGDRKLRNSSRRGDLHHLHGQSADGACLLACLLEARKQTKQDTYKNQAKKDYIERNEKSAPQEDTGNCSLSLNPARTLHASGAHLESAWEVLQRLVLFMVPLVPEGLWSFRATAFWIVPLSGVGAETTCTAYGRAVRSLELFPNAGLEYSTKETAS